MCNKETDRFRILSAPVPTGEEESDVDNPGFWRGARYLRRDQSGKLLCPEFLQVAAEDILAAGKASLLLEAKLRCAPPHLILCTKQVDNACWCHAYGINADNRHLTI